MTSANLKSASAETRRRLLVVEDEIGIQVALEDNLRIAGYDVEIASDGEEAVRVASNGSFDLILLDILLPSMDGFKVCSDLRGKGIDTPIVMLTVKSQQEDKIRGFAAGADDYVLKPFDVMELIARIQVALRRSVPPDSKLKNEIEFGDIRIYADAPVVLRSNEHIPMSLKEHELLLYFANHPNEVVPRERLIKEIWRDQPLSDSRTVDVHVRLVRKKIEADQSNPRWIRTVYGKGYVFVPE